ncbi:MAG: undecaprenyl-diphosphatase UppP [Acidobacteriota bacterium]
MPIWQAVILGILQGLTEFLPVSSSAHLAVLPYLVGWKDHGLAFDVALHFGTLLAVLGYFFRDWLQILAQGFGMKAGSDETLRQNPNLLWMLVLATLPAGIIGLLFEKQAEAAGNNLYMIGFWSITMGLLMAWADRTGSQRNDLSHISMGDSLTIGAAQALAVMPGVSRSGITMTAGLAKGLDRYAAARFSFLLSTPIIAGAALKNFYDMYKTGLDPDMRTAFAVGIAVSALTGALTIRYFMEFLRRRSLRFFVSYRVVFGVAVIILAIVRSS